MNSSRDSHSSHRFRTWAVRADAVDAVLLAAGVASVVIYGVGDFVSGALYHGYSFRDQAISELTAFGSPVRPLMVTVILVHALLVAAFGLGIWRTADRRSLRVVGICLGVAGLIGFPTHTVFAMSSRWLPSGFNDIMHIVLSAVFSFFVFVALVLSAAARPGWFRLYAIATLLVVAVFGAASSFAIQGIGQNATPWAGGFERINAYSYFAWIIVLAVTIIRQRSPTSRLGWSRRSGRVDRPGKTM